MIKRLSLCSGHENVSLVASLYPEKVNLVSIATRIVVFSSCNAVDLGHEPANFSADKPELGRGKIID